MVEDAAFMDYLMQGFMFGLGLGLFGYFLSWAVSKVIQTVKAITR